MYLYRNEGIDINYIRVILAVTSLLIGFWETMTLYFMYLKQKLTDAVLDSFPIKLKYPYQRLGSFGSAQTHCAGLDEGFCLLEMYKHTHTLHNMQW